MKHYVIPEATVISTVGDVDTLTVSGEASIDNIGKMDYITVKF